MSAGRVSSASIVAALNRTMGRVYLAAEQLGCDPTTIYHRAKKCAAVRKAMRFARGKAVDTAECALMKAVLAGEAWAVCFTLKTLGKGRGYVERAEHRHGGDPNNPTPIPHATLTDEQRAAGFFALLARVGPGSVGPPQPAGRDGARSDPGRPDADDAPGGDEPGRLADGPLDL